MKKLLVTVTASLALLLLACNDDGPRPLSPPVETTTTSPILPGANIPAARVTDEQFCDGVRIAWGGDIDALIDALGPMDPAIEKVARDTWARCK